jgi:hypothetical protein
MTKTMTPEEMAAEVAAMRDKHHARLRVMLEGREIFGLKFEVVDHQDGRYHMKVHALSFDPEIQAYLEGIYHWRYWTMKNTLTGGAPAETDPLIKAWPGGHPQFDGQIDSTERAWMTVFAVAIARTLKQDVQYTMVTRMTYPNETAPETAQATTN